MSSLVNLTRHLLHENTYSRESLELANIINQLVLAAKLVSREVTKAGLVDILGATGEINVQQEEVQKLDVFANTTFIELLKQSPYVKAVGSEEVSDIVVFNQAHHQHSEYIVHLDPLDGCSNIDVNVSVGTNFVIFRRVSKGKKLTKADYLQAGKQAVCAGYFVYGSSTMLVYSTGGGVHGFTLDPSIGEFILSHERLQLPEASTIYSINESYYPKWGQKFRGYVDNLKKDKNTKGKIRTARYIGSLVADFHRNLLKGGIFLYPADKKHPNGKLRLLYEGIPFAYLIKQAGGYASNGQEDVLEIVPKKLHQRIPLFIGNTKDVKEAEKYL
ncbi:MAG: class 1 fructose-bisphosphatase [Candidatus Pacebacteria bacterium]|nr:class 1 fructose-bisphosphatase [Candidatus Paceibacterota bacterium]